MRIIENNNTFNKRCNSCNSLLAIETNDISYQDVVGRFDCICTVCGMVIKIESNEIPKSWISVLARKIYMQTDSFFCIGKSHSVCEDYAFHGKKCIILSDGCSASEYSDIGARLLCITAKRILNSFVNIPLSYSEFGTTVAGCVAEQLRLLDLPINSMDATLLVAFEFNEKIYFYAYGDGYYQIKYKNQDIHFGTTKFNSNAPYYLSYWSNPQRNIDYINKFGNEVETITGSYTDGEENCELKTETVDLSFSHETDVKFPIPIDELEYIMIMSDGVESFQDYSNLPASPIETAEIIKELSSFKNTKGKFITRRTNAAIKKFMKQDIDHYDDLSVAGMYMDRI